jgi:hypothetical protein
MVARTRLNVTLYVHGQSCSELIIIPNIYTECGRNSELIINKNNILLKAVDTNFNTSQFTVLLICLKVTAYVKIPALRDTLAEKHVTKMFKSFTISAAPCISIYMCVCVCVCACVLGFSVLTLT